MPTDHHSVCFRLPAGGGPQQQQPEQAIPLVTPICVESLEADAFKTILRAYGVTEGLKGMQVGQLQAGVKALLARNSTAPTEPPPAIPTPAPDVLPSVAPTVSSPAVTEGSTTDEQDADNAMDVDQDSSQNGSAPTANNDVRRGRKRPHADTGSSYMDREYTAPSGRRSRRSVMVCSNPECRKPYLESMSPTCRCTNSAPKQIAGPWRGFRVTTVHSPRCARR